MLDRKRDIEVLRKDIVDKQILQLAKEAMNSGVSKQSFKEFLYAKMKEKKKEK